MGQERHCYQPLLFSGQCLLGPLPALGTSSWPQAPQGNPEVPPRLTISPGILWEVSLSWAHLSCPPALAGLSHARCHSPVWMEETCHLQTNQEGLRSRGQASCLTCLAGPFHPAAGVVSLPEAGETPGGLGKARQRGKKTQLRPPGTFQLSLPPFSSPGCPAPLGVGLVNRAILQENGRYQLSGAGG